MQQFFDFVTFWLPKSTNFNDFAFIGVIITAVVSFGVFSGLIKFVKDIWDFLPFT